MRQITMSYAFGMEESDTFKDLREHKSANIDREAFWVDDEAVQSTILSKLSNYEIVLVSCFDSVDYHFVLSCW